MFLRQPPALETRSTDIEEIARRLDSAGFGTATASGANITDDGAMRETTVYACVRILSESIAQLPIMLKRENSDGTIERIRSHPILDLINHPNEWQTAHDFWQHALTWMELRGNAFAFIQRGSVGQPQALLPLSGKMVQVEQLPDWSIRYFVGTEQKSGEFFPEDILHVRHISMSGYKGMSTIAHHRESVGLALQTEKHGAAIFKNNAAIDKVFTHPSIMSEQAQENFKRSLANYRGAGQAGGTLVVEEGMSVEKIGMTSEDAQYLQTRKFQKEQIATIFGVPGFLLNDADKGTTWGSGLEQITKAFLIFALSPRIHRIEQTITRQLLTDGDRARGLHFKFDTSKFEVGDFKDRMEGYRIAIESGIINPDEARVREGMNPRPGGDEYRIPSNQQLEADADEQG